MFGVAARCAFTEDNALFQFCFAKRFTNNVDLFSVTLLYRNRVAKGRRPLRGLCRSYRSIRARTRRRRHRLRARTRRRRPRLISERWNRVGTRTRAQKVRGPFHCRISLMFSAMFSHLFFQIFTMMIANCTVTVTSGNLELMMGLMSRYDGHSHENDCSRTCGLRMRTVLTKQTITVSPSESCRTPCRGVNFDNLDWIQLLCNFFRVYLLKRWSSAIWVQFGTSAYFNQNSLRCDECLCRVLHRMFLRSASVFDMTKENEVRFLPLGTYEWWCLQ